MARPTIGWRLRLHRWLHYEYWPLWALYAPMAPVYLWQAARSRAWVYFSAVNPAVGWGGAFGVSKADVLRRLPAHIVPPTVVAQPGGNPAEVLAELESRNAQWPLVAKPDWGERGDGIVLLRTPEQALDLLARIAQPYVVQGYAPGPLEFGVLWSRHPAGPHGRVTSIMQRGFLSVTGDGHSTVTQLMAQTPRAAFQIARLARIYPGLLAEVVPKGTERLLEPIGNHSRGTVFRSAMHLDANRLARTFDELMRPVVGLDYGRFDLRCATVDDLYAGRFQVVELNGVASEPAHIYQPGFGLWRAWGVLAAHWRLVGRIARANHKLGVPYASFGDFRRHARTYKQVRKSNRGLTARPGKDLIP